MSRMPRYRFFCDKLSHWRALGISYHWDDGFYFGFYVHKYFVGICQTWPYEKKEAVVKTEDLRKDL